MRRRRRDGRACRAAGGAIEIVDATDHSENWVPDGVVRTQAGPGGRELSRRAAWQDGVLLLEQVGSPLALTRRVRLAEDGRRLLVALSFVGPDGTPATAHLEYVGVD